MPRRGENIRKRTDGRWEGRYYVREAQTGRRIQRSVYARTYGETKEKLYSAKKKMGEAQGAAKRQDAQGHVSEINFSTVAEEWLTVVGREKKYATYIKYRMIYDKHIREKVGMTAVSELDREALSVIFRDEGQAAWSDSLQKSISCVLHQILSYGVSHFHADEVSCPCPRHKTGVKPVEVLNSAEQARLLQYLYGEMDLCKLGIVICISTGLRLGEICSLKWKDIDLEGKMLCVNSTVQRITVEGQEKKTALLEGPPKSSFSKREIPLSEALAKLLAQYYSDTDKYVLNKSKPMEPRTYQNKFHRYLMQAGVRKANFHALRHTFATNCIDGGADVKSLSEILGHSDVKITLNRYVHPTVEIKRRHMNALASIYGQLVGQK